MRPCVLPTMYVSNITMYPKFIYTIDKRKSHVGSGIPVLGSVCDGRFFLQRIAHPPISPSAALRDGRVELRTT